MEMCYNGALVMPKHFVEITNDEMEYIDGGITTAQKAIIIGAVVVAGAALIAAVIYGQFWLAAKLLGYAVKTVARKIGAKAVIGVITSQTGLGAAAIGKVVNAIWNL
ncbi:MAG: class IIb bacteriocin, lactobin A/cerein 7B family [Acutalibacteraceae bacterium]|nr:class IIb bacteriocin, lactobin A/cerein 7B family [Acutalibacteraceae bacterium]